jgi:hypothetical protein
MRLRRADEFSALTGAEGASMHDMIVGISCDGHKWHWFAAGLRGGLDRESGRGHPGGNVRGVRNEGVLQSRRLTRIVGACRGMDPGRRRGPEA